MVVRAVKGNRQIKWPTDMIWGRDTATHADTRCARRRANDRPTKKILQPQYKTQYQVACGPVVMQNRLVLLDLPPDVPRRANSADALRDLVEEHGCWVDRFAFLYPQEEEGTAQHAGVVAAVELHLENVRDRAVKKLDSMLVTMDEGGDIVAADVSDAPSGGSKDVTFRIRAAPATASQSSQLVELSPLEEDDGERIQTLQLPNGVHLTVARSTIGGGTGADPWRGGILLSKLICSWSDICDRDQVDDYQNLPSLKELFHAKDIIELGAGSSGLPSMALACLVDGKKELDSVRPSSITATDGVDEIVNVLSQNVAINDLSDSIDVQFLDWNHLSLESSCTADTILFSDCVYNEEGADALSNVIQQTLRPGGSVLGVLPDMRVGLSRFEGNMKQQSFEPRDISMLLDGVEGSTNDERFLCSGGGTKNYRVILWHDSRS